MLQGYLNFSLFPGCYKNPHFFSCQITTCQECSRASQTLRHKLLWLVFFFSFLFIYFYFFMSQDCGCHPAEGQIQLQRVTLDSVHTNPRGSLSVLLRSAASSEVQVPELYSPDCFQRSGETKNFFLEETCIKMG